MAHFKTLFYLQKASAARWGQQPCWGIPGWSVSRLQGVVSPRTQGVV